MGNFVLDEMTARGPFRKTISLPRRRDRLHIMPTSTGYEVAAAPSYAWDGRRRGQTPFSVLQHTIAGAGQLQYERRHYTLSAGETMLIVVPHNHRYWVQKDERWEFFWIAMSGHEALRLHRAIQQVIGPVFRLRSETVARLARCSLDLLEGRAETPGEASAQAYSATMALYDDLLGRQAPEGESARHAHIGRVAAHIRNALDQPLEVAKLAELAGVSRSHFTRLFCEQEGVPPAEFVIQERMRRAARLLVNATLSVKEIAVACGFDDPNYFAKAFRRTYGTSPSQFRTTGMYASAIREG